MLPPLSLHAGRRVLFLMAAPAEYGSELQRLINPVFIGVGPVEAGIATANALSHYAAAGALPDLVINLGSAGSNTLEQGVIYAVQSVSYRDMDASPLGFPKGRTPFLDLPVEVKMPVVLPGLPAKRLSTGANIVSGAAYHAVDADMVDMETFAVLRACQHHHVPLAGLRGISDGAKDLHHYDDWTALLGHIDVELAKVVADLHDTLSSVMPAL